ncbi:hypothetical protein JCM3765_003039 [Sporobolomyces pararoseus]
MSAESTAGGSPPRSLPSSLAQAAQLLRESAAASTLNEGEWDQVATAAKAIADGLKNHQLRSSLGDDTEALPSVGKLMELAVVGGSVKVKMELCRVVGNACFDHDENRQLVLDANIPLLISNIINSVTRTTNNLSNEEDRKSLTLDELRMLRASVGAILNSSLKFDPIRKELGRSEILEALLSLIDNRPNSTSTKPVYYVGLQLNRDTEVISGETEEEWEERLSLGETIAGWTMNVLEDVLSEDNKRFPSAEGIPILASILLSVPISRSSPSSTPISPLPSLSELSLSQKYEDDDEEEDEESHLDTSIELLSISAALLEGLTLDHDIHKQTISLSSYDSSSPSPSLLYRLLEFIECASPPTEWTKNQEEKKRLEKTFEVVKAATIRAVVEGMNDDKVMHELWKLEGSGGGKGGNWLVEKLVSWLEQESKGGKREDLMVCASHMLAGLGRSDQYVERLVHEFGLVDPLAQIIKARVPTALLPAPSTAQNGGKSEGRAGENTQILYGAVSLMRHLAIPMKNRPIVSATQIIPTLSQLLSPSLDIVKPLQMSVVGLLKHLTSFNITSSVDILSADRNSNETPVDLILALIKRTDELQLRSESTRVLINLVRTLFSASPSTTEEGIIEKAREIMLQKEEIVKAISEQVRLSEKYPVLVNEGIVALSLLSGGAGGERGASIVLSSLLRSQAAPLPEVPSASITEEGDTSASTTLATRQPPKRTASLSLSPSGDPPTSLDMLLKFLSSMSLLATSAEGESLNVPPEMISNVCTLLITTIKNSAAERPDEKEEISHKLRPTVKRIEKDLNANDKKEWERAKEAVQILSKVIEE